MADFLEVRLGAALSVVAKCVETHVDIRAVGVHVAKPALVVCAGDALRRAHPLNHISGFGVAHEDG